MSILGNGSNIVGGGIAGMGTIGIANTGSAAQQAYPTTLHSGASIPGMLSESYRAARDTMVRINRAENGFIVEVGEEASIPKRFIAKDMSEVRDLITSDMVTRRMEGK